MSTQPKDIEISVDDQAQIHQANDMLATALHTNNRVVAESGHNVMLYDPGVVVDTVESVQARVR